MTTKPALSRWRTTRSAAMPHHEFVGLVNALAPFEPQGEGDSLGEVARLGWRELVIHDR
jgi:hypothetical protein